MKLEDIAVTTIAFLVVTLLNALIFFCGVGVCAWCYNTLLAPYYSWSTVSIHFATALAISFGVILTLLQILTKRDLDE